MPVEAARVHQPRHRDRGLVWPAQRPPDAVLGHWLGRIVRPHRAAGGVHPERAALLGDDVEDDLEPWLVQRRASDVGVHLRADRTELGHRPVQFGRSGLRIAHRQRGRESSEPIGEAADQRGEFVVGRLSELQRDRRLAEFLKRRNGQREHLPVIPERVDRPPARVEVDQRRVLADPRPVTEDPVADLAGRDGLEPLRVGRREYVGERIDLRHVPPPCGAGPAGDVRDRMEANDLVSRLKPALNGRCGEPF